MERRRRTFGNDLLDRAGSGLSVIADLESARTHARAFQRLGHILVRYHLPDNADITIDHLVGADYHFTLLMKHLPDLAQYLDTTWWEVQDFPPTNRK